ncbi:uncharacterized protein isoform X1 [Leptinotarsa decemlineata]|uniref:uncharacterized protein isoform X1 n=2 Tax=Leptinotarsa decemlineata TaxID=7539 RepID=UPI003D309DFD
MGFARSCSNSSNSERSFKMCTMDHSHSKTCSHIPNHSNFMKKHSCLESPKTESVGSLKSASLPPRPTTRRNPYEMPRKLQGKSRSQPTVALPKKKSTAKSSEILQSKSKKNGKNERISRNLPPSNEMTPSSTTSSNRSNRLCLCGDEIYSRVNNVVDEKIETEGHNTKDDNKKKNSGRNTADSSYSSSRVEEHEYLQFLLRITEDIIVNNYFRNIDIEKVFKNHIELNKGRLDMQRMKEHVADLASELNIPYNSQEAKKNKFSLANLVVNPLPIVNIDPFQNCTECSSLRALDVSANLSLGAELECYGRDNCKPAESEETFINRRSLGRVTECTEPSNSIETILNPSSRFASRATLSTLGNDTLSNVGNVETPFLYNTVNTSDDLKFVKRVSPDENFNIRKSDDISLTEKERKVSTEEEIIFEKLNNNNNASFGDAMETSIKAHQFDVIEKISTRNNENSSPAFIFSQNIVNELNLKFTESKYIQTTDSLILMKDADTQAEPITTESLDDQINTKDDKGTQVNVIQCDRKCGSSEVILKNHQIEEEYVLIQSPVYVSKQALRKNDTLSPKSPNRMELPIAEKIQSPVIDKSEDVSVKESSFIHRSQKSLDLSDYAADISLNRDDSFHAKQTDFTKLLSSDYDLTPERDNSTTDKYHHLLVDASTSFSNVGTELEQSNLLLSDKYALFNKRESIEGKPLQNLDFYYLSNSESVKDDSYEFRNYTISSDKNNVVKSFSYCINGSLDSGTIAGGNFMKTEMSLDDYEIGPRSAVEMRDEMENSSSATMSVRSSKEFSVGEIISRTKRS